MLCLQLSSLCDVARCHTLMGRCVALALSTEEMRPPVGTVTVLQHKLTWAARFGSHPICLQEQTIHTTVLFRGGVSTKLTVSHSLACKESDRHAMVTRSYSRLPSIALPPQMMGCRHSERIVLKRCSLRIHADFVPKHVPQQAFRRPRPVQA
jgi:hypothetical protein